MTTTDSPPPRSVLALPGARQGMGRNLIIPGVVVLAAALTLFSGFFTIDQSERGVVLRNGAYHRTAEPGLHFKLPWIELVVKISVQTQTETYEKVNSYSSDQQPADIRLSVSYHVDASRVADVYSEFGSLAAARSRAIDPHVFQEVKVVFGRYTAVKAIQDRARLNSDAVDALRAALAPYGMIVLEGLQIENIDFSPQYIEFVEQRMQAEVEVQKIQQNAEREKVQAQIKVIQAQGEADSTLARAKADAEATKLRGEAEASAIKAKGDALAGSPGLVGYTQATRWNGVLPSTMIPGGAVPMLELPAPQRVASPATP